MSGPARPQAGPQQYPAPQPRALSTASRHGGSAADGLQVPAGAAVGAAPRAVTRPAEAGRKWLPRAGRPDGPGAVRLLASAAARGLRSKMAADLEAEVQAIDRSLLECSAEEIAVVRRRDCGGRARSAGGEAARAAGRAGGIGLPGWRWRREAQGPFCARDEPVPGPGGEQALRERVSLPKLVIDGTPGWQRRLFSALACCCGQLRCCSSLAQWQQAASFSCCSGWRRWLTSEAPKRG